MNPKPIADLLSLGFEHGVVSLNAIRAWGDWLIEHADTAEDWMIDIAFTDERTVQFTLANVPGDFSAGQTAELASRFLSRLWSCNSVAPETVRSIGWQLYQDDRSDAPGNDALSWAVDIEIEFDALADGHASDESIRTQISESLRSCAGLLPKWLDAHVTTNERG